MSQAPPCHKLPCHIVLAVLQAPWLALVSSMSMEPYIKLASYLTYLADIRIENHRRDARDIQSHLNRLYSRQVSSLRVGKEQRMLDCIHIELHSSACVYPC